MDYVVQGINAMVPEIMIGFNERNEDEEYIYDRLIVKDAYRFNHNQHVDLILRRADCIERKRVITMAMFRRYARYAIDINLNCYRSVSEPTELELRKKCYVRAQSSFTHGYGMYIGSMCDTYLIFDRIVIQPAES